MSVTLRDIAERAGVAVSTASRVLRSAPGVLATDRTRQQIVGIAEELGYRPNLAAQALRSGKASLISVVTFPSKFQISAVKAVRLQGHLSTLGREVLLIGVPHDVERPRIVDQVSANTPEAVVIFGTEWEAEEIRRICKALRAEGVFVVLADYPQLPPADLPCDIVVVNRTYGADLVVSHLLARGHRHIGLLTLAPSRGRAEGYDRALERRGIGERYKVFLKEFDWPHGHQVGEAACELKMQNPQITAIFCGSDLVAGATMYALMDTGLRIPDDVALVGFDNDPLVAPLTTVAQPAEELGAVTAEVLRKRLRDEQMPWQRVDIPLTLVVRGSSVPAQDRAARTGAT